jgi:hypothetical protein
VKEEAVSWWVTGVFALTAIAGVFATGLRLLAAVVALALFVGGAVLMAATLVIAAGRSRAETIDIGGLFFSQAPQTLRWAIAAQAAIGLATAAVRATAAFGVLVPVFGLGLCGLWGARHGTFPARET